MQSLKLVEFSLQGLLFFDLRILLPDIISQGDFFKKKKKFKLDPMPLGHLQAQEKSSESAESTASRSQCRKASLVLIKQQKGHLTVLSYQGPTWNAPRRAGYSKKPKPDPEADGPLASSRGEEPPTGQ